MFNSSFADISFLRLIQLSSPALPVGAFSYSEGLETLVHAGQLTSADGLHQWITEELRWGAMRLEAAILVRGLNAAQVRDTAAVNHWNQWLSALRETEEMRQQSWQMGRSLHRLLLELAPDTRSLLDACGENCNFAIAFAVAAAHWQIDSKAAVLGYLHSWASNLVTAGVKLIPLGQTAGQKLLLDLLPALEQAGETALQLPDDELECCGWGVAIASMTHETLYSRLFRS